MLTAQAINTEIANIIQHGDNRADIACLADLYVCREAMRDHERTTPIFSRGSEFEACINGKCFSDILPFIVELLETIKLMYPRLYESFMAQIR